MNTEEIIDIFVFITGIGAMLRLGISLWKGHRKAQENGIIRFHITAGYWQFLLAGLALTLMAIFAGRCFFNSLSYQREAARAREYGISDLLEKIDVPENGTVDLEGTAGRYIAAMEQNAHGAKLEGMRYLGIFLILVLINVRALGGYVTRDGWCGICGEEIHPLAVTPEGGKLCFYTGTTAKLILRLSDTPEHRERYAVLIQESDENQSE